jgi:hypothetical protein
VCVRVRVFDDLLARSAHPQFSQSATVPAMAARRIAKTRAAACGEDGAGTQAARRGRPPVDNGPNAHTNVHDLQVR